MRDDGRRGHGWFGASRGGGTRPHNGIDIRADLNQTPIVALLAETVSAMGPSGAMGNRVIIDHGNGLTSHYGHLQTGSIRGSGISGRGQTVQQGQRIGTAGNTGNAGNSTPLHFEIRRNGVPTNPATFLNQPCPP